MRPKLTAFLAGAFVLAGCVTTPDGDREPDWPRIQQAIGLGAASVRDYAAFKDEPTRGDLIALADAADKANESIGLWLEGGASGGDVVSTIDAILVASDPLLVLFAGDDPQALAYIVALRGAVRIAALFIPNEQIEPPTQDEVDAAESLHLDTISFLKK